MHMQSPTTYYHKSQMIPVFSFLLQGTGSSCSCAGYSRLGTADSMCSGNIIRCGIRLRTKRCKKGSWMLQGIESSCHLEDPYSFSCELRILAGIASHYRMQMYWRFKSSSQSWSQNTIYIAHWLCYRCYSAALHLLSLTAKLLPTVGQFVMHNQILDFEGGRMALICIQRLSFIRNAAK